MSLLTALRLLFLGHRGAMAVTPAEIKLRQLERERDVRRRLRLLDAEIRNWQRSQGERKQG